MKKIATKWLITILGVMIVALSLLGVANYTVITNHYRLYMESSLLHRATSYASILGHDFNAITLDHVSGMEHGPLTGVYVFSATGKLLTSSGLAKKRELFSSARAWALQNTKQNIKQQEMEYQQGIVMAKSPIYQDKKKLGTVVVVSELTWLESTLHSLESTILLASTGALLVATGLSILLSRRIVRPLLDIRKTVEQLARGDYEARVNVEGEDELASLAKQMNRLAQSLSYYQSSRREFLSHVAHELRTPLTYVKGYASLLQKPNLDPEKSQKLIKIIREQSHRLERIVDDLVTLSRLDEGQLELHREKADMGSLLQKVTEEMRPRAEELGIKLNLEIKQSAELFIDMYRFQQIIMNLVDNALRYSKNKGTVTVTLAKGRKDVIIEIIDQGIGIPPHDLNQIWERFYRVEKSRSRKYGGSGLGLSIVKHLVELHGGTIDVRSTLGKGTTFIIKLPISKKG
jgi:two-component system, OmpR family, sensor histidine kinase BaeS